MGRSMEIGEKIAKSREMGATDDQIIQMASQSDPEFAQKYSKSIEMGAQPSEILDYLSKPNEKGFLENTLDYANKGVRVGLQGTIGAIEGSPLGMVYDLGAMGVNLARKGGRKAASMLGFEEPEGFEPTELPTIGETFEKLGSYVGVDTKPQNKAEHAVRLAANLKELGKKAVGWGVKEAPSIAKELKAIVSGGVPAVSAMALKDVAGIPEWAGLLLTSVGAPTIAEIGRQSKNLAGNISKNKLMFDLDNVKFGKGFSKSIKDEWGNAQREALKKFEDGAFSKEQYEAIKPYLEKAAEYNIPVNLGALTDSQTLRTAEQIAANNNLTGEARVKFFQDQADAWSKSVDTITNRLSSTHRFSQQGEVADALLNDVTRKEQQRYKDSYTKKYELAANEFANSKPIPPEEVKKLENALNKVNDKLGSSLSPTTAEEAAKSVAQKSKSNLLEPSTKAGRPEVGELQLPTGKELYQVEVEQAGREIAERQGRQSVTRAKAKSEQALERKTDTVKESQKKLEKIFGEEAKWMRLDPETGKISFIKKINGKNLTDTVRSLNSYIEWDNPEVKNLMKGYLNEVKSVFGRNYAKSNPEAYKNYLEANSEFAKSQSLFGESAPFKKWGIRSDSTPEDLVRSLNTPSRFKEFEKEFGSSQSGKDLIAEMKRIKVKEKLMPLFDNWKPGKINTGMQRLLRDAEFNSYLPKEVRKDLVTLKDLDRRIESFSKSMYEKGVKVDRMNELSPLAFVLSPAAWLETKALSSGAKSFDQRTAKAYADVLFDKDITHKMVELGKRYEKGLVSVQQPSYYSNLKADMQAFMARLQENVALQIGAQGAGHTDEDY